MTSNQRYAICADSRTFSASRRAILTGLIGLTAGLTVSGSAAGQSDNGLSHSAESIHQELSFAASRRRVYDALTNAKQFEKVVQLSAARKSMAIGSAPAQISLEPGGSFELFGGYVTGRQVELVPDERIVQVWHSASWAAGEFSIARFVLQPQGANATKLVFDHTGFPSGEGEHLATGWRVNYWEPLTKYFAS